jgi:hypothetical protein
MDSAFALRFAPAPWNDRLDRSGSGMTVSGTKRTRSLRLAMSVHRGIVLQKSFWVTELKF